jgi:branched-chain amino acid aminotransferase
VIALAHARGVEVVERHMPLADIEQATEVFLAGTAAEVTPVRQIAEKTFSPGKITEMLLADYEALVRMAPEDVAKRAA